ncbi:uncharacterized protein [Anabrus simplex]|uniref:uncharacterized protein n=1 Tax=Anabrus simplex TaxID=316456 RepID=UPI0035A27049
MRKVLNFVKGKREDRRDLGLTNVSPFSEELPCQSAAAVSSKEEDIAVENGWGYNIDFSGKDKSVTKLHKAAWQGNLEKLKVNMKKIDIDVTDKLNRTPLHLAAAQGHTNIVWFLLSNKAKINICDNEGKTPFLKAIECGHKECVHLMLERGVDLNTIDYSGNSGLHTAAKQGFYEIASLLLKQGANFESSNNLGESPLHIATQEEHRDLVELLLRYGSSVNVVDRDNRTPLMFAAKCGNMHLVQLFLEYGAQRKVQDSNDWTAEDYAVLGGHHDVAAELKSPSEVMMLPFSEPPPIETIRLSVKRSVSATSLPPGPSDKKEQKDQESDKKVDDQDSDTWNDSQLSEAAAKPQSGGMKLIKYLPPSSEDEEISEESNKIPDIKEEEIQDSPRSCVIPPPCKPPRSWDLIQSGVIDDPKGSEPRRRSLLTLGSLRSKRESFTDSPSGAESPSLRGESPQVGQGDADQWVKSQSFSNQGVAADDPLAGGDVIKENVSNKCEIVKIGGGGGDVVSRDSLKGSDESDSDWDSDDSLPLDSIPQGGDNDLLIPPPVPPLPREVLSPSINLIPPPSGDGDITPSSERRRLLLRAPSIDLTDEDGDGGRDKSNSTSSSRGKEKKKQKSSTDEPKSQNLPSVMGTLGREGTMLGYDEVWEANAHLSVSKGENSSLHISRSISSDSTAHMSIQEEIEEAEARSSQSISENQPVEKSWSGAAPTTLADRFVEDNLLFPSPRLNQRPRQVSLGEYEQQQDFKSSGRLKFESHSLDEDKVQHRPSAVAGISGVPDGKALRSRKHSRQQSISVLNWSRSEEVYQKPPPTNLERMIADNKRINKQLECYDEALRELAQVSLVKKQSSLPLPERIDMMDASITRYTGAKTQRYLSLPRTNELIDEAFKEIGQSSVTTKRGSLSLPRTATPKDMETAADPAPPPRQKKTSFRSRRRAESESEAFGTRLLKDNVNRSLSCDTKLQHASKSLESSLLKTPSTVSQDTINSPSGSETPRSDASSCTSIKDSVGTEKPLRKKRKILLAMRCFQRHHRESVNGNSPTEIPAQEASFEDPPFWMSTDRGGGLERQSTVIERTDFRPKDLSPGPLTPVHVETVLEEEVLQSEDVNEIKDLLQPDAELKDNLCTKLESDECQSIPEKQIEVQEQDIVKNKETVLKEESVYEEEKNDQTKAENKQFYQDIIEEVKQVVIPDEQLISEEIQKPEFPIDSKTELLVEPQQDRMHLEDENLPKHIIQIVVDEVKDTEEDEEGEFSEMKQEDLSIIQLKEEKEIKMASSVKVEEDVALGEECADMEWPPPPPCSEDLTVLPPPEQESCLELLGDNVPISHPLSVSPECLEDQKSSELHRDSPSDGESGASHNDVTPQHTVKSHHLLLKEHLLAATAERGRLEETAARLGEHAEKLKYELADAHEAARSRDEVIALLQSQLSRMEDMYTRCLEETQHYRLRLGNLEQELRHLNEVCRKYEDEKTNLTEIIRLKDLEKLNIERALAAKEEEKRLNVTIQEKDRERTQQELLIHMKYLEEEKMKTAEEIAKLEKRNQVLEEKMEELIGKNQALLEENAQLTARSAREIQALQEDSLRWKELYESGLKKLTDLTTHSSALDNSESLYDVQHYKDDLKEVIQRLEDVNKDWSPCHDKIKEEVTNAVQILQNEYSKVETALTEHNKRLELLAEKLQQDLDAASLKQPSLEQQSTGEQLVCYLEQKSTDSQLNDGRSTTQVKNVPEFKHIVEELRFANAVLKKQSEDLQQQVKMYEEQLRDSAEKLRHSHDSEVLIQENKYMIEDLRNENKKLRAQVEELLLQLEHQPNLAEKEIISKPVLTQESQKSLVPTDVIDELVKENKRLREALDAAKQGHLGDIAEPSVETLAYENKDLRGDILEKKKLYEDVLLRMEKLIQENEILHTELLEMKHKLEAAGDSSHEMRGVEQLRQEVVELKAQLVVAKERLEQEQDKNRRAVESRHTQTDDDPDMTRLLQENADLKAEVEGVRQELGLLENELQTIVGVKSRSSIQAVIPVEPKEVDDEKNNAKSSEVVTKLTYVLEQLRHENTHLSAQLHSVQNEKDGLEEACRQLASPHFGEESCNSMRPTETDHDLGCRTLLSLASGSEKDVLDGDNVSLSPRCCLLPGNNESEFCCLSNNSQLSVPKNGKMIGGMSMPTPQYYIQQVSTETDMSCRTLNQQQYVPKSSVNKLSDNYAQQAGTEMEFSCTNLATGPHLQHSVPKNGNKIVSSATPLNPLHFIQPADIEPEFSCKNHAAHPKVYIPKNGKRLDSSGSAAYIKPEDSEMEFSCKNLAKTESKTGNNEKVPRKGGRTISDPNTRTTVPRSCSNVTRFQDQRKEQDKSRSRNNERRNTAEASVDLINLAAAVKELETENELECFNIMVDPSKYQMKVPDRCLYLKDQLSVEQKDKMAIPFAESSPSKMLSELTDVSNMDMPAGSDIPMAVEKKRSNTQLSKEHRRGNSADGYPKNITRPSRDAATNTGPTTTPSADLQKELELERERGRRNQQSIKRLKAELQILRSKLGDGKNLSAASASSSGSMCSLNIGGNTLMTAPGVASHHEQAFNDFQRKVSELEQRVREENSLRFALEVQMNKMRYELQEKSQLERELGVLRSRLDKDFVSRYELDQLKRSYEAALHRAKHEAEMMARDDLSARLRQINAYIEKQVQEQSRCEKLRSSNEAAMRQDFQDTRLKLLAELAKVQAVLQEKGEKEKELRQKCEKLARECEKKQEIRRKRLIDKSYSVSLAPTYTNSKEKEINSKGMLEVRSPLHHSCMPPVRSPVQNSAVMGSAPVPDSWPTDNPFSHILRRELEKSIRKHTRSDSLPEQPTCSSTSQQPPADEHMEILKKKYFLH